MQTSSVGVLELEQSVRLGKAFTREAILLYFLRQGLSLNLEVTDSARLATQQTRGGGGGEHFSSPLQQTFLFTYQLINI